jgi:hypothetical protein
MCNANLIASVNTPSQEPKFRIREWLCQIRTVIHESVIPACPGSFLITVPPLNEEGCRASRHDLNVMMCRERAFRAYPQAFKAFSLPLVIDPCYSFSEQPETWVLKQELKDVEKVPEPG